MRRKLPKPICHIFSLKVSRVGLVINPSCPYLGCSPDGMVYDDSEDDRFGLLERKCSLKATFTECDYLKCVGDVFKLKTTHNFFTQVMGQLGITGLKWYDVSVWTENDYHKNYLLQPYRI